MRINIYVLFLFLFASCTLSKTDEADVPLARVYDKVLNLKDLEGVIPPGLSPIDSTEFAQNFINKWVKSTLMLHRAIDNIDQEKLNINKLVEDYRTSLLVYRYQQQLISQKFSPKVGSSEVKEYYKKNIDDFVLQNDVVEGAFVRLRTDKASIKKLKKWYASNDDDDKAKFDDYCVQHADLYTDFRNSWIEMKQVEELFPKEIPTGSSYYNRNKLYQTEDDKYTLLVFVDGYKNANELSPLGFVYQRIENILLSHKRKDFIKKLEEQLYDEGLNDKVVKFY